MLYRLRIMMLLLVLVPGPISARDSLVVMFWNMENFFDHIDQGNGDSDREFSPSGSRHWTAGRFYAKCDAVAKSILWIGDRYGRMPDLIGLSEIENRNVLVKLLKYTILRKYDYKIIHYDSSDRRGIDVAILYRGSVMTPVSVTRKVPYVDGQMLPTRDILHSRMMLHDGAAIDFIVNHHPSKFGGEDLSAQRRDAAMMALRELCDSLGTASVVAMGDFNDTPDGESFRIIDDILTNKGAELHQAGKGTIRYEGRWELIDMFMTGSDMTENTQMHICMMPFHSIRETRHPGQRPFRTYSGPRYIGGISDHYPIVLLVSSL